MEFPQHPNGWIRVGRSGLCEYFGAEKLPGCACAREVCDGVAQALKGSARGCRLWRVEIKTDAGKSINHGSRREKVLDREPAVVRAGGHHGHIGSIAEARLQLQNPLRGRRSIADRAGENCPVERGRLLSRRQSIAPHKNVRTNADLSGAGGAPAEPNLKLLLSHAPTVAETGVCAFFSDSNSTATRMPPGAP